VEGATFEVLTLFVSLPTHFRRWLVDVVINKSSLEAEGRPVTAILGGSEDSSDSIT